jgi:hypothetical protein
LNENLNFLKTHNNSYKGPLSIINPEYGSHNKEIRSFSQFLPQNGDFQKNRSLTPMDFERKNNFFETRKNSCTGPLSIANL